MVLLRRLEKIDRSRTSIGHVSMRNPVCNVKRNESGTRSLLNPHFSIATNRGQIARLNLDSSYNRAWRRQLLAMLLQAKSSLSFSNNLFAARSTAIPNGGMRRTETRLLFGCQASTKTQIKTQRHSRTLNVSRNANVRIAVGSVCDEHPDVGEGAGESRNPRNRRFGNNRGWGAICEPRLAAAVHNEFPVGWL